MKVTVTVGDEPQEVDVAFHGLTLQESVILEELLGVEGFDRYVEEATDGMEMVRPSVMRAMLFAKLKGRFPDLEPTDFDIDMTADVDTDSGNDSGS